ncbi:phage head closure protein [Luteolibacter yonseiensis]|uniref:Phage head closure protein n=1 Tax=Luteolibacter yonseiensis TaxID=1144680 RepID=A0A934R7H8_9BACT|nr:phage head closure protein [Luteolibacter yonseiensis]MBK1816529.1 phage head closure protein [Luteolibacter yonseiensis]
MNPGKMDRRIRLQKRTFSRDTTGSNVETWADNAGVWAEDVKQGGGESVIADADRGQDTRQFRIRHRDMNAQDYRVSYDGKIYEIRNIQEEGRKNTLLLDTVATQGIP